MLIEHVSVDLLFVLTQSYLHVHYILLQILHISSLFSPVNVIHIFMSCMTLWTRRHMWAVSNRRSETIKRNCIL